MKYCQYLHIWLVSFRLKTLPLAVSSILVGNALAFWQSTFSWSIFWLTLITASLLQILSNLANDYGDNVKGADNIGRIGPKRGIHHGDITSNQLLIALLINTLLCIGFGLWLVMVSCEDIKQFIIFIIIGAISIIAAITYTIGKKPYGYIGLGDLSVLLFFGLISVLGSFYLQHKSILLILLIPALACGLLSVAVLNMNNLRDYYNDKANNKKTVVVFMGIKLAKCYHVTVLICVFVLLSLFSLYYLQSYSSWLFLFTLPLLYRHLVSIYYTIHPVGFNLQFISMIKLSLFVNLLYSIGIILS